MCLVGISTNSKEFRIQRPVLNLLVGIVLVLIGKYFQYSSVFIALDKSENDVWSRNVIGAIIVGCLELFNLNFALPTIFRSGVEDVI